MKNLAEVCSRQTEIIKKQSDIIDDLFLQVMQYATVDEEERDLKMIAEAARLRKEVGDL